ncbi:peroxiredoxin [Methylobacillus arboreus]|uniref:peroxiredoxin n=1 Tax=Methylobacillus arboreus TaxID=755170 RepID=UPI001E544669|nr:peroxiredoxin [Methylobacillus arboreus]MCB5191655.1 peroxiredoxin [Methylobacillus arboreus]
MLQTNTPAPDFSLLDADMENISLSALRDRNVVLYFYPKDNTPSCTLQAIEFSDLEDEFKRHETIVIGISRDDCISHASFRDKHGLAVRLLSDEDGEICAQYGVWQEKEKDGIKKMGIVRSTFVIDRNGMLRLAQYGVAAKGHATEILNFIKSL